MSPASAKSSAVSGASGASEIIDPVCVVEVNAFSTAVPLAPEHHG